MPRSVTNCRVLTPLAVVVVLIGSSCRSTPSVGRQAKIVPVSYTESSVAEDGGKSTRRFGIWNAPADDESRDAIVAGEARIDQFNRELNPPREAEPPVTERAATSSARFDKRSCERKSAREMAIDRHRGDNRERRSGGKIFEAGAKSVAKNVGNGLAQAAVEGVGRLMWSGLVNATRRRKPDVDEPSP